MVLLLWFSAPAALALLPPSVRLLTLCAVPWRVPVPVADSGQRRQSQQRRKPQLSGALFHQSQRHHKHARAWAHERSSS